MALQQFTVCNNLHSDDSSDTQKNTQTHTNFLLLQSQHFFVKYCMFFSPAVMK